MQHNGSFLYVIKERVRKISDFRMYMEENLKLVEKKYKEMLLLINNATEGGQFNSFYFEQPFKEWYAKEFDKKKKQLK